MSRRRAALTFAVSSWLLAALASSPAEAQIRALPPNVVEPDPPVAGQRSDEGLHAAADSAAPETLRLLQPLKGHRRRRSWANLLDAAAPPLSLGLDPQIPLVAAAPVYEPAFQHALDYGDCWSWQLLPDGLIYRSYLAGMKESRFASHWIYEQRQGWLWDATLGGRVGLLRYGTRDNQWPEGWQLDVEGAAFPRMSLEPERDRDLVSSDFRFGIPLTFRSGRWEGKLAYYHFSSHLGDEFLLTFPDATRINYVRDAVVLGVALRPCPQLRLYTEADWAFNGDGGGRGWQFQFGAELSPAHQTGVLGAPFLAVAGHIREEIDYGGSLTAQTGWAWRSQSGHLARLGVHYFNGKSSQFQFLDQHEEQIGLALWYDY